MKEDIRKIRMRQKWLALYAGTGSVTKTALRCGIARSTLYRWINRGKEQGKSALSDKSKRPSRLANMKMTPEIETIILDLREKRRWGSQRIANYLLRKEIKLSAMTVWRVLKKHQVEAVVKRRKKSDHVRYSKEIPGERVQPDVMKVRNGAYRFTAIDDCTRLGTIRVYPNTKAGSTIHFSGEIPDTFPFPVQRIQTDWGTGFFNYDFPYEPHDHFIKFRPIKPRTPQLNGKVERSRQTDKTGFWNLMDLSDKTLDLNVMAMEWQEFYNKKRPHSSLDGKTPMQKLKPVGYLVPIQPDVSEKSRGSNEEILPRNYEYLRFKKHRNKKTVIQ